MDLPKGFHYQILSRTGDKMNDGYKVPGKPDGTGCFNLDYENRVVLVRNHELGHKEFALGPFDGKRKLPDGFDPELCFDTGGEFKTLGKKSNAPPFTGGTTNLVYNLSTGKVEKQFLSLVGTDRNCAGGVTPWNSWVTCEEPANTTSVFGLRHGYNFDVPASDNVGITKPVALKEMGRFRHEAVAVDPDTGYVYQTEDRGDGVIYRFLPKEKGNLSAGGKLQALVIAGKPTCDTRNWDKKKPFAKGNRYKVEWIDLDQVDTPEDDLRYRAAKQGAAVFARAEGMWYGSESEVGERSVYFACTNGGKELQGQIFRYFPDDNTIELYLEPNRSDLLRNADNITISPSSGHLFICEDLGRHSHIRGVNRDGQIYTFSRNPSTTHQGSSELAGACFSPNGKVMFVNIQNPGITLAIHGPFI